jgi:hypothetical protein
LQVKSFYRIFLIAVIIITAFLLIPSPSADAAETGEADDSPVLSSGKYRTGSWFVKTDGDIDDKDDESGTWKFVTTNRKATTGIKYRTVKFVMRLDTTCKPDNSRSSAFSAQCTPTQGGESEYIEFELPPESTETIKRDGYRECAYAKEVGAKLDGCNDELLVSVFSAPAKTIKDLVRKKPGFEEKIKENTKVYFSPIFKVSEYGTLLDKEYKTLADIRSARSWKDKSYFIGYYDVPVEFHSANYKFQIIIKDEAGNYLKKTAVYKDPKGKENYKVGQKPDSAITLDETITTSDGKVYTLACSYEQETEDDTNVTCGTKDKKFAVKDGSAALSRKPAMQFGGTDVVGLYKLADCKCSQEVTIPNKKDLEGTIAAEKTVIGVKVPMQVDLQQTEAELDDWKLWTEGKTDFKLKIRLWRSDQTDVMKNLSNTGASALWTKVGWSPPAATDQNPEFEYSLKSKWELLAFLDGGSDSKAIYTDDLTKYPIPEGGKVSFRYNASVTISGKAKNGDIISKTCSRKPSPTMTWFRPKLPPPQTAEFTSVPKYWSEIKEGSPQTSGTSSTETFDAMSGTPTTRSLYFASGGSEFIVDVQVEYVPKVTETRKYTSIFTPVTNGWAMSPITGPTSHGSPPSPPSPRTKTDDAGASYTETVTLHSFKHVLKPYIPCSGTPCTGGQAEVSETDYYYTQDGYDFHQVGGYTDTWTQTVTFDYMKINKAAVWKLDRSKVDGMATLVGTNEVTASVTQGDPNVFYNIAAKNTSAAGRLRYSLETDQHDNVVWNEGSSDNSLANNKSGKVDEQKKFDERRKLTTNVTAISDFLILQTSSGDQSVMYFQKASNTAKTTEQLDVPVTSFETMWANNSLSAAKWNVRDTIKVGSYNGQFGAPTNKYSGGSTGTVATIFDTMPAGLNRPARPAPYMRLMATGLDVPDTLPNDEYVTGTASVFYKLILPFHNPDNDPIAYQTESNSRYSDNGQDFDSAYSSNHSKVNDVVIHNPISVEDAMVLSLPASLDQRTPASKAIGGNKQEGYVEYERVLNPNYRQNILPNPDAELINEDTTVAGWNYWVLEGNASNIAFTRRTGDTWVIEGTNSFEVNSVAGSGTKGGYWKDIPVKPDTNYQFEADMSCHRCSGFFSLDLYSSSYGGEGGGFGYGDVNNSSTVQHKTISFRTTANTSYVRIHMIKGDTLDAVSYNRDYLFVDNMSLKNMDVQEFVEVDGVYVTSSAPNPDYVPAKSGANETFNYSGSVQEFTAADDGVYTIEVWGAQGGLGTQKGSYGSGGLGGHAKGDITLTKGQKLSIYVGGQGGSWGAAGWNGGGSADSSNGGGGGASDVRFNGTALGNRIIVAGGGGGGGSGATGGSGGGTNGGTGTSTSEVSGGAGGTQLSGYSIGLGGSVSGDASAGGGGYYGGQAAGSHGCENPNAGGGGGSGYIGGVTNATMSNGERTGNGLITIKTPARAAIGSPTIQVQTLAGGISSSPPSEAYILNPIQQDPMAPINGNTPGDFVILDYGFKLSYPNTGNFFGNGQWGWSSTTDIRGKGFVDNMDTTEWTKEKYVKFDFNVIYDDQLYKSNEWISLSVPEKEFDFYVPLANRERVSALVEFKSIAINAPYEDNNVPTNKVRNGRKAKHSTEKMFNIDVVGRIGNMVIEDTGDFRFSNLFKQPVEPTEWIVQNVVKKVDTRVQNQIIGDSVDIRGQTVAMNASYLNTYGLLSHLQRNPLRFPLEPEKNNIQALKNQPLRLGYSTFTDIQTIGNYYTSLQVIPYYYHLNLKNGDITPVDIYMDVDGMYKPINKFGAAVPGWNPASVYSNPVFLDWDHEAERRNVNSEEAILTDSIAYLFGMSGGDRDTGKAAQPHGTYQYGTSQIMNLTGRNRTYIGNDSTYTWYKNPGNRLSVLEFGMQAQRWHFQFGLPSSAVAVPKDMDANQQNIDLLRTNTSVLLLAADIMSIGDTYALQYSAPDGNRVVNIAGITCDVSSIPYPLIAVYSSNRSSAQDLDIYGTH